MVDVRPTVIAAVSKGHLSVSHELSKVTIVTVDSTHTLPVVSDAVALSATLCWHSGRLNSQQIGCVSEASERRGRSPPQC